MEDPVLLSRLKALSNNLAMVIANLEDKLWRSAGSRDVRAQLLEKLLWEGMRGTIVHAIKLKLDDLETEIDRLQKSPEESSTAWQRYHTISSDSQILLRESLEIIGTLAIRNKENLDQKILYLADELARDCLSVTIADGAYYLTVHGLGDTLRAPRARIIRMRFPDWTIWDLPLIAYELGHATIDNKLSSKYSVGDLEPFLVEQGKLLLNQDGRLRAMMQQSPSEQESAQNWARDRVNIFVADAFATYMMGPAYACSAINLRFNPWVEAHNGTPSDAQRAYVVMSMLEWMGDHHSKQMLVDKRNPYEEVAAKLKSAWDGAMAQSKSECGIATSEEGKYLTDFTHHFAGVICRRIFTEGALYPLEGWVRAKGWCEGWLKQQKTPPLNITIPTNTSGKLRDVLNATWQCRMLTDNFSQIEKDLANVGKTLCEAIIEAPTSDSPIPSSTSRRVRK